MTIVEKHKGKIIKKVSNTGVPKEEYNALTNQVAELNNQVNNLNNSLANKEEEINNGKQLIADAIGEPLINADSTFDAMSETIIDSKRNSEYVTGARDALYNAMVEDGYNNANNKMTVDELIDLLDRSNIEIGDVKQIDCGYNHTFILKNDDSVWSCGYNFNGQLGLGTSGSSYNKLTFTQVTTDVKQISCGGSHTFLIKNDGSLWACGSNTYGQLGLGDNTDRTTFTQVTENINYDVKQIAGGDHTFILKNDGSLWSCGLNRYGQLGLGDTTNRNTFTQVTTNISNDVKEVICGYHHTFIIKNDGSVWSCGSNDKGQLGLNSTTNKTAFTKVTTNINNDVKQIAGGMKNTFILKNDGSVWACGYGEYGKLGLGNTTTYKTFTQVTTNINNDVKQIACGYTHTIILKNDGSVWCCGQNSDGQLGLNDTTQRTTFTQVTTNVNNDVKQVILGQNHTFIIKNDGSLWGCGWNDRGQLGLNDTTNRIIFTNNSSVSIPEEDIDRLALYNYLSTKDIEVTEDMDIRFMLYLLVDSNVNNKISNLLFEFRSNMANNGVLVEGGDHFEQLIDKVAIMAEEGKGVRYKSGAYSLGEIRAFSEPTYNGWTDTYYQSINIPKDFDMNFIYAYTDYSYSVVDNGVDCIVYATDCILYDPLLQTLDDGSTYVFIHSLYDIYDASTDEYYYGGNWNTYVKLIDDTDHVTLPLIGSCYGTEAIPLSYDNITYNAYYAVGFGEDDATLRNSLTSILQDEGVSVTEKDDVFSLVNKVDEEFDRQNNEMEDLESANRELENDIENTRNRLVGLMQEGGYNITGEEDINNLLDMLILSGITISSVKQIVCGYGHTFIIRNDGSVWVCGNNEYGQFGIGTTDTDIHKIFTQVNINISVIKQVACGGNHIFILKTDGSIWACGQNNYGQLGLDDTTNRSTFTQVTTNINNDVKQVICGATYTFIIKTDDSIWACGLNNNGQLGLDDTTQRTTFTQVTTNISDVKQIACGSGSTYILKNDGSVYSCGLNDKGQLGLGDTTQRNIFTKVTNNVNNDVKQIACGEHHTFILKNDGSVYSCGYNNYGQLGLNDKTTRNTFTQVTTNISNDVKQIVCGYSHTFILKNDGSIWSCGYNAAKQLGLNDYTDRKTFTKVTTNINNDVKQVICGAHHTFILKNNGSIWSCGWNGYGQLGVDDYNDMYIFTIITKGLY